MRFIFAIQHFIPVEMQKGNLQAQQAAIADIPVNSPPAPSTQGYQQQLYHQPLNAATNFPPGENDFECRWLQQYGGNPCGQRFSDKRELVMHLNRVHGVNGSATRVITCRWLPHPTLTVCNRLLKRCSFSRHVDVHFRHSIACPYQGCGKTYSRRDSLKIHMKTHSNVIFNT